MELDRSLPMPDDLANRQRSPVISDELAELRDRLADEIYNLINFTDDIILPVQNALDTLSGFAKDAAKNREFLEALERRLGIINCDLEDLADRQARNE